MLGCENTITIIHHNKDVDGDTYVCTVYDKASWFKKLTISTSGDGAKPVNSYDVRIMGTMDIDISVGDFVAIGIVGGIKKQSDIKADHFRVTAIGDNRRGGLAHWRISGQ